MVVSAPAESRSAIASGAMRWREPISTFLKTGTVAAQLAEKYMKLHDGIGTIIGVCAKRRYEMDFEWMFRHHTGRRIDKWRHYFAIYDRHLDRFRGKGPRVLEIGVDHGGSLQLWKHYFGHGSRIVGLDIDPRCAEYEEDQIQVRIGNQADVALLKSLGQFDVVIDDGSHRLQDQLASFEALWPRTGGVYLIEDCHERIPLLDAPVQYVYPWVVIAEKPQRLIRGIASRELRADEIQAEVYRCL